MLLRRTLVLWPKRLRGVFTFDGPPLSSEKTSKAKTPSPMDVDTLMAAVQEADEVQVPRKGRFLAALAKGGVAATQDARHKRKKLKMGPREKYMFKKMQQRERDRPSPNDPASDLTPLYEITGPWSGFSSLKDPKQKREVKQASEKYTTEEKSAIIKIRKMIYGSSSNSKDRKAEHSRKQPSTPGPVKGEVSSKYFRSAESVEQESGPAHRAVLTERLATRLHRAELESKHEFLRESESMSESTAEMEDALKADPSFQQDALRLESESQQLEHVDEWIDELRSFAEQHERVLEAMEPAQEPLTVPATATDTSLNALGDMADALKQSMVESGINVDKIERQAERELQREHRIKKKS